jgi:YHS domain-containing protein
MQITTDQMQPAHSVQTPAAPSRGGHKVAAPGAGTSPWRSGRSAWWRYTRHLLEMLAAMFAGMILLGIGIAVLGSPPGSDTLLGEYGYMAVAMSLPMVVWMRRMGHPWWDCWEMTAWMVVPMFALVLPVALGLSAPGLTVHSLMLLSHVAMIGGMAALMLYRWDTYALGAHCHSPASASSAATVTPSDDHVTIGTDPVCGMPVDPVTAPHTAEYEGRTYAFCAPGCRKAFQRNPAQYLAADYTPSM